MSKFTWKDSTKRRPKDGRLLLALMTDNTIEFVFYAVETNEWYYHKRNGVATVRFWAKIPSIPKKLMI